MKLKNDYREPERGVSLILIIFGTIVLLLSSVFFFTKAQVVKVRLPDIYQTKSSVKVTVPTNKTFNLDVKQPKSLTQQIGDATVTSNLAIYKDNSLPVYQTKTGKLFIVYANKNNTGYNKKYINPQNYE